MKVTCFWLRWLAVAMSFASGRFALHADEEPAPIIVPVRLHLMHSESEQRLNTTLTETDLQRILGKVNKVWSQAGICFVAESISQTPAIDPSPESAGQGYWVAARIPKERLLEHGLNIIYVKEIEPNGIWTGGLVIVKDTARLKQVADGLDEPIPRVTSHELGHALGLPHRQDLLNLMASGTTGLTLNAGEIQAARSIALEKVGAWAK